MMRTILSIALASFLGLGVAFPLAADDGAGSYIDEFDPAEDRLKPELSPIVSPIVQTEVSSSASLMLFTDRPTFDSMCPLLPLEEFENTNAPANAVVACSGPINSASNDACFSPGAVIDGFTLTGIPGQLIVLTPTAYGVTSTVAGPNSFADDSEISFSSNYITGVGVDLLTGATPSDIDIEIFGIGDVSLGMATVALPNPPGQFLGVLSDQPIARIAFSSGNGELFDNLAFGTCIELDPTSIEVSKTASFDGRYVSGTISIANMGENPAMISVIADSLEVHFPRKGKSASPPLPGGSTPNWFKVADVPVVNPGLIPVGETASIDYSFDLCGAADFAGANAMRNVVAVTLANKPEKARKDTVVTRSESFKPETPECPVGPVTEDLSPCFAFDIWEFDVTAGQAVFVEADTLDAATAADLCFVGDCGGADFFFGDDDFACTFPPPAFSCPRDTFAATTSGTCNVWVQTCSSACADPGMANYSLTVQRDGSFADLTLVADDL